MIGSHSVKPHNSSVAVNAAPSFVRVTDQQIERRIDHADDQRAPKGGPKTGDAEVDAENFGGLGSLPDSSVD